MVDQSGLIRRDRERRGDNGRQPGGFDLVTVRGEGFEAVPQPVEWARLVAESELRRARSQREVEQVEVSDEAPEGLDGFSVR